MSKRKICIVTGSRAEYGLFYPILKKIQTSEYIQMQLIVTTAHLSSQFGLTYRLIEKEFFIDDKVDNIDLSNSKTSVAKSTGLAITLLSDSFNRLKPDALLLLGDRFETHAAATTAMLMNIPIAHIHGGEITEGSVDEQIRHSITKMSHLHFCSTEEYRKRIIQMGENPLKVINSGAPGIDNILNLDLLTKKMLEENLKWKFSTKCALFTYHPETLKKSTPYSDLKSILTIILTIDINVLFTYSNADYGGKIINEEIENFCKDNPIKYKVVKNLGQQLYLSAMKHVDLIIGNTSSGIIEAASFEKPVVNIGNRQKGRLRGENVIDCNLDSLKTAIGIATSEDFIKTCKNIENIYGSGDAADIIVKELINQPLSVVKKFIDLKC